METAKVIVGNSEEALQQKLDEFFNDYRYITVHRVLQTSCAVMSSYQTTITIFYSHNV